MGHEQILGDYKVVKHIGQGPCGAVYVVEHRFIKQQFILKALPQELMRDPACVARFEEEVAKLAQLDHPHLVKVCNVCYADDTYFLVTECVVDSIGEMTNLAQYMAGRKEALREEELLSLARQIASALDYMHERGVVHGNLKLNTILVGRGKPGIDVVLSDMALTRILSPGSLLARTFYTVCEAMESVPIEVTREGDEHYRAQPIHGERLSKLAQSFLQSYAFFAPEQKKGGAPTRAADSYAFGVLLYYLITGEFVEGVVATVRESMPQYTYDWDRVLYACLAYAAEQRPLILTPLLGHKGSSVGVETSMRQGVARDVGGEQRLSGEVTPASMVIAQPEPVAGGRLRPVIRRTAAAVAVPQGSALELAEKRDLSEATAPAVMPTWDRLPSATELMHREPTVKEYHVIPQEQRVAEPLLTEMVVIPGGKYRRGSQEGNRDEAPAHSVELAPFALDIHPVTNEQFVRFLEYRGGEKDDQYNDLIRLKDSRINRVAGRLTIESGYNKHPVIGVTWYGSVAYAQWVGKRLPTEAEWEIAARAGQESNLYPTGKNIDKTQANFFSSDTTAVMSYGMNAYGLFDMAGNVYEWCQDWYSYSYYEVTVHEPVAPHGPAQGVYRVLRGGCWKSLREDLRCAHRHRNNPGTVNRTYGFRCAADVEEI